MSRFPTGSLFNKEHKTIMEQFQTSKPLVETFSSEPLIQGLNFIKRPLIEGSSNNPLKCSSLITTPTPSPCPSQKYLVKDRDCSGTCDTGKCCDNLPKCTDQLSDVDCSDTQKKVSETQKCKTSTCKISECCVAKTGYESVRATLVNMGAEMNKILTEADKFVIDESYPDTDKRSCSYWQGSRANNSFKKNIMRMGYNAEATDRNDPNNSNTVGWKGRVLENRDGADFVRDFNNGNYFNTVEESDFLSTGNISDKRGGGGKGGGVLAGPMGGFDYAVCGEKYNAQKHGNIRTEHSIYGTNDINKINSDKEYDIPGKPFIGDCIGLNDVEFNNVMEGSCLTTKDLYEGGYGDFLVCPPNNRNNTTKDNSDGDYLGDLNCKIKNCNSSNYNVPFKMAICKRQATPSTSSPKIIYHIPVKSNTEWKCGNVELQAQELDGTSDDQEYKCPNKETVNKILNTLYTKRTRINNVSKHTDVDPVSEYVQWTEKDYSNISRNFLNNLDPCYNFGNLGGGDETLKMDKTDGTQIFYDELRIQNENNAANYGWFNMKDNGWKKNGELWTQTGVDRIDGAGKFEKDEPVWVLVNQSKQDDKGTHLRGNNGENARWLPGKISKVYSGENDGKYDVRSLIGKNKNSRMPNYNKLLKIHHLRIRKRDVTSDTNSSSKLDQIWAKTICGGTNPALTVNQENVHSPSRHDKPKPPIPDMGCNFAPTPYKTKGFNCYKGEKAASKIPLLFQRKRDVCQGGTAGEGKIQCENSNTSQNCSANR